jgi:putative DNA methylase
MNLFGKQAIAMTWDFPEAAILYETVGGFMPATKFISECILKLPQVGIGIAVQQDAMTNVLSDRKIVSTDPPYYDNIGYADLSDFFYVWMRKALKNIFPSIFSTVTVPKAEELIASPFRQGNSEKAEQFFLDGMTHAMHRIAEEAHPSFPITIYYAFKQSENESDEGFASTGWETFLDAVIHAGFALTGTWPMRSEQEFRMVGLGTNALASSIILVCRPRPSTAPTATRREFVNALKSELPLALLNLQKGNIAPVDLAQAAIGPGMGVYTRYSKVLDSEGKQLTVRDALTLINETLDIALAEQEGDFDADSRWALTWFEQSGFAEGEYGVAEQLSKSKNTSVAGMVHAGILQSKHGKVRLLKPSELPKDWDPETDDRLTTWEMVHHLIRVLEASGEGPAAELVKKLGAKAETARELCYRLYTICERKKRAVEALSYNALVQSWPEIIRISKEDKTVKPAQTDMFSDQGE